MREKYCCSCGRKKNIEGCCINKRTLSVTDKFFLAFSILMVPPAVFVLALRLYGVDFFDENHRFIGNFALILVLLIFIATDIVLKKKYLVYFFACHQKVTRSFLIHGKTFSLCARCTGILLGIFGSLVLIKWGYDLILIILMSLPLILDGILQKVSSYKSNNGKRIISGILFGPMEVLLFSSYHFYLIKLFMLLSQYFHLGLV